MKSKIIFTTLLIEKSPQSIPLGAACVASAVKNNSLTKNLCDVELLTFNIEDFENTWNQKQKKNNFQNKNHSISTSNDVSFGKSAKITVSQIFGNSSREVKFLQSVICNS